MAKQRLKVLCVHGLGGHEPGTWEAGWEAAVRAAVDPDVELELGFAGYDFIFKDAQIGFKDTIVALYKLGKSGVGSLGRREKNLIGDVTDKIRWTAGYVVAWVEDEEFQAKSRAFMLEQVRSFKPDVILAHSLGSLITYNAFTHNDARAADVAALLAKAHYVTLGSQIGNPFVYGNLTHGRIDVPAVRHWHHLYNEHDDVLTAPIKKPGVANFSQLLTPFDLEGSGDHSAPHYITHPVTVGSLWAPLSRVATGARRIGGEQAGKAWRRAPPKSVRTRRRALLVGINDYARAEDRLEGCINDVFTMSAVLQECGFAPEDIRTCLDSRATAKGILDRLEWLLGDAQPGDQCVFYYSGHGARLPEYGQDDKPDRLIETLVPYDFDWSAETMVSDEQMLAAYSQLPYDTQLALIFDCCHSGGMHRQGGAKARGITPPDDIRHRELKWDIRTQMWVDRDFDRINADFSKSDDANKAFFGEKGATVRLGRAGLLRQEPQASYSQAKRASDGPIGPYLPLIIEACGEDELSYEYRHGATSYGAFTFCLASLLRENRGSSFEEVVQKARARLKDLRYDQTPQILGPTSVTSAKIPWAPPPRSRPAVSGVPGGRTPETSG